MGPSFEVQLHISNFPPLKFQRQSIFADFGQLRAAHAPLSVIAARIRATVAPMSRSAFSLLAVLVGAAAVECDWAPDPAAPQNNYPIDDAPLRLNRTVANGKAYLGGQPGFEFYVLHLFGSNYEMGFAHGLMFKNEITEMQREMWLWLESQIADDLPKDWPAWFAVSNR